MVRLDCSKCGECDSWLAFAMMQKFASSLRETVEAAMPAAEDEAAGNTDIRKAAHKRNFAAMCDFTLAFVTESLMSVLPVQGTDNRVTKWKAHLVVAELFKKCRPRDIISGVEFRQAFDDVEGDDSAIVGVDALLASNLE